MQTVKTTNKPLSIDGQSVSSNAKCGSALFGPLKPKASRRAWIAAHEMWVAVLPDEQKRAVTPVVIEYSLYWMDAITGGIHWPMGTKMFRNANEAEEILLNTDKTGDRAQPKEDDDEE